VGRENELNLLTNWLISTTLDGRTPCRLVTLVGTGGSGKTSLAIEVARRLLRHFPDGVWLIELAGVENATEYQLLQRLAVVLGLTETGGSLQNNLITYLRNRRTLLVLDNCEQLVAECAQLSAQLLQHCPQLQLLVTSREFLNISGEQVWYPTPLSFPAASEQVISGDDLLQYGAIQLFVERARAVQPLFELTAETTLAVVQICHRLDRANPSAVRHCNSSHKPF
jgi:predicted ATPase